MHWGRGAQCFWGCWKQGSWGPAHGGGSAERALGGRGGRLALALRGRGGRLALALRGRGGRLALALRGRGGRLGLRHLRAQRPDLGPERVDAPGELALARRRGVAVGGA